MMASKRQSSMQGDMGFNSQQEPAVLADALTLASQSEFDQLKGHFLASLNHEIRTPLSGVLGMTDLLLETRLDEEQREFVATARECASQLLDTLNAILEYSAISAGNLDIQESEFHLRQILEGVATEARLRAESKGLRLTCECAREVPETVVGDPRHLKQILTHLVRNAVKFTSRGQVDIRADYEQASAGGRQPNYQLRIRVADTGIGIPPEKLRLIFESFRQLETGLARSYSGLGLGLAIVEKLVRMMRGKISATSRPGGGSVFTVEIPFGAAMLNVHEMPSRPRQARKHRILVVEDNRIAQQVVSHLLRRNQYEVDCADSGAAGIDAASDVQYDLILMDLQMPGMDGLTATKRIRMLPGYAETPILALTANYSDEYRTLCEESGMQGFLFKPIQKDEVLSHLRRFLA